MPGNQGKKGRCLYLAVKLTDDDDADKAWRM